MIESELQSPSVELERTRPRRRVEPHVAQDLLRLFTLWVDSVWTSALLQQGGDTPNAQGGSVVIAGERYVTPMVERVHHWLRDFPEEVMHKLTEFSQRKPTKREVFPATLQALIKAHYSDEAREEDFYLYVINAVTRTLPIPAEFLVKNDFNRRIILNNVFAVERASTDLLLRGVAGGEEYIATVVNTESFRNKWKRTVWVSSYHKSP